MSRRLPALTPRKVIRAFERRGFILRRIKGSHYFFQHPADPSIVVSIPYHSRDMARGTLLSIIRKSGLTVEEFLDLL
ncbi:MAG: type II toxin-antitoxin system HicA family toxin [Nitrospinota bacterium]|nr:type II toxin-antitoxin system HicA family toxin [Nitrospinota bacterium]MDP7387035.1 type II toxin-antitoxin system HicA family toxin [Nitrospinota bacterium]